MRLLLLLSLLLPNLAFAAPSDFNGDGVSDLGLIKVLPGSQKTLRWKVVNSSPSGFGSTATVLTDLGKIGDHIAVANWSDSNVVQAGVVSPGTSNTDQTVTWKIQGGQTLDFGTRNDALFIAGADFDGSGYSDAAVASFQGKKLLLTIKGDPFASNGVQSQYQLLFGQQTDRLFFLKALGANDWIALLRSAPGKSSTVIMRNLLNGKQRKVNVGNSKGTPLPIRNSAGVDSLLAFVSQSSTKTTLRFRDAKKGNMKGKKTINSAGTVVVGDFLSEPGYEIAVQTESGYEVYNPFSKQLSSIVTETGIAIDQINMNSFSPEAPGLTSSCPNIEAISSGYIYKTGTSSHFNPGDPRNGGGSFIIRNGSGKPNPSGSCVKVYDAFGNIVDQYARYGGPGDEWLARFYSRGLSCSGNTTPAQAAAQAFSNSGSYSGYFKVSNNKCIKVSDLRKCYGSNHC